MIRLLQPVEMIYRSRVGCVDQLYSQRMPGPCYIKFQFVAFAVKDWLILQPVRWEVTTHTE